MVVMGNSEGCCLYHGGGGGGGGGGLWMRGVMVTL